MSVAPASEGNRRPLEDIRAMDFATIMAAPYTAMLLADHGADVVKVEHLKGDGLRLSGPGKEGDGLAYSYYGRNKRNIVVVAAGAA